MNYELGQFRLRDPAFDDLEVRVRHVAIFMVTSLGLQWCRNRCRGGCRCCLVGSSSLLWANVLDDYLEMAYLRVAALGASVLRPDFQF